MKKRDKNLLKTSLVLVGAALIISGCSSKNGMATTSNMNSKFMKVSKINIQEVCNVQDKGITSVLTTASKYNKIAKSEGLEFMRLGMKTSQYIKSTQMAVKNGSDLVDIVNKKKKKTGTVSTSFAAWRACSFAISALQQAHDAKTTWKLATPGDGFTY